MKLKISANAARERITDMIVSGNILLEKVTGEYFDAKKSGAFDEKEDIPQWKDQHVDWLHKCLAVLQDIFPTPREAIGLKNTQAQTSFQSGVNIKWSALANDFKAKLSALDGILKSVDKYSVEMTHELFIEDIDSFAKARDINPRQVKQLLPLKLLQDQVQTFFEEIIGEQFHKQDSEGKASDSLTIHVKVGGDRLKASLLLKGSGIKGKLTINKCGKSGLQIEKLVEAPADLYVVQHVDGIDERVITKLRGKIALMNSQGKKCRMCIVDGTDTARILLAYGKIQHQPK
ncbi:MAG: hypothetical protein V3U14_07410 [candidate division NC10 bacterium]